MKTRRFLIAPELIKGFEVFVGSEVVCFLKLEPALNFFIEKTAGKTYRTGKQWFIRGMYLESFYWKVYYKDGHNTPWNFWEIMTNTKKKDKSIGFGNLRIKRTIETGQRRARRAKVKALKPLQPQDRRPAG